MFSAVAAETCPSGYIEVVNPNISISSTDSCPAGHTVVQSANLESCIDGLANGAKICTYFAEKCPAGKYFDGTDFLPCDSGMYCPGTDIVTPGQTGCYEMCPDGYEKSDVGAKSATQCYTACKPESDDIIASGKMYYTDDENTGAAECIIDNYVIYYHANGASGDMAPSMFINGVAQNLRQNTFKLPGKEFLGWATSPDGDVILQDEETIYNLTDIAKDIINLYAIWQTEPEFSVTTTELSNNTLFSFTIYAAGTYYIDWGDGSEIEIISKESVGSQTISHRYQKAGQYTIGILGQATSYNPLLSAISFSGNKNISRISGSLGAIFGTLTDRVNSDGSLKPNAQPRFNSTFYNCTNLKGSIPENLFAGVSGAPMASMFYRTFYNCSGLTGSIPENLFGRTLSDGTYAGISGDLETTMFAETFSGCSGLTGNIPENLFGRTLPDGTYAGISGDPESSMFARTFYGCSGLTGNIPENLFGRTLPDGTYAGISGEPALNMFVATF